MLVGLQDPGNGTGHSVFRPELTGLNAMLPELASVGRPDGSDAAPGANEFVLMAQPLKSLASHFKQC